MILITQNKYKIIIKFYIIKNIFHFESVISITDYFSLLWSIVSFKSNLRPYVSISMAPRGPNIIIENIEIDNIFYP